MKSNPQLKRILVLLILLFVSLFWVYYSGFVDIKTKSQNISEMQDVLLNTTKQNQYLDVVSRDVSGADSSIGRINNLIIGKDNDVAFIEKFETTAKNDGLDVKINSLDVVELDTQNSSKPSDDLTTLKVKATTSGSWQKTYAFLADLETLPFVIRIEKFALSNSSDTALGQPKKGTQVWQAVFELSVLKYK